MAQSIFVHLDSNEKARAKSIQLFANESRLARKLRCGLAKDFSVVRSTAHALTHPYIQPNSRFAYARIVFDLDWHSEKSRFRDLPLRYLAQANAWTNDLGVPQPTWVAISKDKNSAHIAYELETPVARHDNARMKPQRYLAAIESAMALKLGADEGFNGELCKNPLNETWDFFGGPPLGRDLHELADYVELKKGDHHKYNRTPRGEVGRNVYLFDEVRFWAYDNVGANRSGGVEAWQGLVIAKAEQVNMASYYHLPELNDHRLLAYSECAAIGRSVARWTWKNHGKRTLSAAFSELQAWRGARGAAEAAKVKRARMEQQISAAIGQLIRQGDLPTMGQVARMVGCTKSNLSTHYKHLFQATVH